MNIMIRILLQGILPFYMMSCSGLDTESPEYVKIADQITAQTAQQLEKQKHLIPVGEGGRMMHDIQAMFLSFEYHQEVNLTEARELVIYALDTYLSNINGNQKVKPYLHDNPFTVKNVEILILIREKDGDLPPKGKIYFIAAEDGTIRYKLTGEDKYKDELLCKETYEEAKAKLK